MTHAREPEDIQPFSFQSLIPHSMLPTICFLSFTVLWQLDNPLKKYKTKSLWMIHLVSAIFRYCTFFQSVFGLLFAPKPAISFMAISHSHPLFIFWHLLLICLSLCVFSQFPQMYHYKHTILTHVLVGSKCLETTMKIWNSKSNVNLKIHRL